MHGDGDRGLLGRRWRCGPAAAEEIALDRDRALREVAVADDPSELAFGLELSGGGPAQAQWLTLRWVRRTISIIDLHGFVEARGSLGRRAISRWVSVSVSSMRGPRILETVRGLGYRFDPR